MPFEVRFDEVDGIVKVRVSGLATTEDHETARDEAFRLCRETGCSKVLVDLRELNTGHSTTAGCYAFGTSVAQEPTAVRFAHVMPADVKSREDVEFATTVEANRGVLTRDFETVDEARRWLLGHV